MKKFKEVDAWLSTILIISFTIATIINRDNTFITGYFVVGGWQVISMIVHVQQSCFTENKGKRKVYHWITAIALLTMPVGSFIILLFTAPFMALYYTWLCFDEVRKMNERPLAMLK
ncbi:MAG: hypothetical protein WBP16_05515 [Ferruginibacter sp.]